MKLLQCVALAAVAAHSALGQKGKQDDDDDKFSIGLGVLAPSYRQKVGTGKELGAQIDFNSEGKGFSYTVSQGDPTSGKPYSSIQISRPAPVESSPASAGRSAPAQQYSAAPPPQYIAAAPPAAAHHQPHQHQHQQQQQQYAPPPATAAPRYVYAPPTTAHQHQQYVAPQQAPVQQHLQPAFPQYVRPLAPPPQQQQQQYAVSQYQPSLAGGRPLQYAAPQYASISSAAGVQYAQSPAGVGPSSASTGAVLARYSAPAAAAPVYRPAAISYQPVAAHHQQPQSAQLAQVAPQAFGGASSAGSGGGSAQYVPRYQSAPAAVATAYPNALAAPQTYNAPSTAAVPATYVATASAAAGRHHQQQHGAGAPQYVPSLQNVRYQYGSGAEPAFAGHLSIFNGQRAASSRSA